MANFKNYIGVSAGFHDAALSVLDDSGNIIFASHSERYSKIKHDKNLCDSIVDAALSHSTGAVEYHYYEKPLLKWLRQWRSGEGSSLANLSANNIVNAGLTSHKITAPITTHSHHLSHAAAGFQTSPFNEATVVVIDAIGEWDTATVWHAEYGSDGKAKYKRLWTRQYPNSIGLFYTAMTKRVGLRPLDEEYILMGMAAYGKPKYAKEIRNTLLVGSTLGFKLNLHTGVDNDFLAGADSMDIAASSQLVLEELITEVFQIARKLTDSRNIVYMGGVALNCLANRLLPEWFDNIWIMPNPGDAGSSLGAAALGWGRKVNWGNAYLGYDIKQPYPVDALVQELSSTKIAGVANGKAEFGPRALGNRSLLADPRGADIKDLVNEIKRRQKFRPFAPVILEEHANQYFQMPSGWVDSRYMQIVAPCRRPDLYPAITHADGTSRIQTVPADSTGIRKLLEVWYNKTGCPMLLNTSLNIRGEPMVNDLADAKRFQNLYGVPVFS